MVLPLYVLTVVAIAAVGWVVHRRMATAQSRVERHLCLRCGYDLRATVDRCPECAEVPFRRLDVAMMRSRWPASPSTLLFANPREIIGGVVVHATSRHGEATLLVRHLKSRDVLAVVTDGELPGHQSLVLFQVIVAAADAGRAASIVTDFAIRPV